MLDERTINNFRMRDLFSLVPVDLKLVMRSFRIHFLLVPVAAVVTILSSRFGDHLLPMLMTALVYSLSLVFNTQYARTRDEMTGYCVFPLSKTALILSKNFVSFFFVVASSAAVLLVVALIRRPGTDLVLRSLVRLVFVSMILLSTGNVISSTAAQRGSSPVSPAMHSLQLVFAVCSLLLLIFLEGRFGIARAAVISSVTGLILYGLTFSGTRRKIESACANILEIK